MKKRIWIIVVNVILVLSMVVFVVIYATLEVKKSRQTQIEHFENTTITMEHVTENFLKATKPLLNYLKNLRKDVSRKGKILQFFWC